MFKDEIKKNIKLKNGQQKLSEPTLVIRLEKLHRKKKS